MTRMERIQADFFVLIPDEMFHPRHPNSINPYADLVNDLAIEPVKCAVGHGEL
jgi:hypothetical protein